MPVWIIQAMATLGRAFGSRAALAGGTGLAGASALGIGGGGIPFLPAALDPFEKGGWSLVGGQGVRKSRRRRKQALTQSDRNDIAFIAATISKAAAGTFAVQLVSRSR